jgi:hypothetical protein
MTGDWQWGMEPYHRNDMPPQVSLELLPTSGFAIPF